MSKSNGESRKTPEQIQQERARDAAHLAAQGVYRCVECVKVRPFSEGIVVGFGGQIALGICPTCVKDFQILIRQSGPNQIEIKKEECKGQQIVLASSVPRDFVASALKPKTRKL